MAKKVAVDISISSKQGKKAVDDLGASIGSVNEETRSLTSQLGELKDELATLDIGTAEFEELAEKAGEMQRRITEANAAVANYSNSLSDLQGGVDIVGGLTDAFGVGLSVMTLFGIENQQLMKRMVQLQAIMQIGNGIARISNLLKKETNAMMLIQKVRTLDVAGAMGIKTGATVGATAATRALGVAMNALPILAIIAGVTALIGLFFSWGEEVDGVAESIDALNSKEIKNLESTAQARDNYLKEFDRQMALIRLEFSKNEITEDEYNEKVKGLMDERIEKIKEIYDVQGDTDEETLKKTNEVIKAFENKITKVKEHNEVIDDAKKKIEELGDEQNKLLPLLLGRADLFLSMGQEFNRQIDEQEGIMKKSNARMRKEFLGLSDDMEDVSSDVFADFFDIKKYDDGFISIILKENTEEALNSLKAFSQDFYDLVVNSAIDAEEQKKKILDKAAEEAKKRAEMAFLLDQQVMINSLNETERMIDKKAELENYLGEKTYDARVEAFRKEQEIIDHKLAYELSKVGENSDEAQLIRLKYTEEVEKLEERKNKFIEKSEEEMTNFLRDERHKRSEAYHAAIVAEITAQMEMEVATETSQEKQEAIRKKYADRIKKALVEQVKERARILLENEKLTADERVKIQADADAEIARIMTETQDETKASFQEWVAGLQQIVSEAMFAIQETANIVNGIMDEAAARRQHSMELAYEAELEGYNAMLANKTMSQEQFDQSVKEMEQRKAQRELQERKKQFKRDKANNIVSAVMNMALGVTAALSMPAPASFIMAGITAGLASAQIGVISAQQFRANRGGVVPGAASMVDSVDAKLAPGEAVINSRSAAMFPGLLSDINQAGGGIKLAPDPVAVSSHANQKPVFQQNKIDLDVSAYVVESQSRRVTKRVERYENNSELSVKSS